MGSAPDAESTLGARLATGGEEQDDEQRRQSS
jgi:hypothetical protein